MDLTIPFLFLPISCKYFSHFPCVSRLQSTPVPRVYLTPSAVFFSCIFPLALVRGIICLCAMWCLLFLVYLDFVCFFAEKLTIFEKLTIYVFEKLTIGIIWDKRWKYVFPRQIPLLLNCVLVLTTCLETASSKFKIHGYRLTQETWAWPHHTCGCIGPGWSWEPWANHLVKTLLNHRLPSVVCHENFKES